MCKEYEHHSWAGNFCFRNNCLEFTRHALEMGVLSLKGVHGLGKAVLNVKGICLLEKRFL